VGRPTQGHPPPPFMWDLPVGLNERGGGAMRFVEVGPPTGKVPIGLLMGDEYGANSGASNALLYDCLTIPIMGVLKALRF
jgi:hypothetical protein